MEYTLFSPYCRQREKISLVFDIFKNKSISLFVSPNLGESSAVVLEQMDGMGVDESFYKSIEVYKKYKNELNFKNKKFVLFLFHEVHPIGVLEEKLKIINEELEIDSSKIFVYDSTLLSHNSSNKIPLQLKFKQYYFDNFDKVDNKNRKYKFTFLNGNVYEFRLLLIDKIISSYKNNIDLLRNENVVSVRKTDFIFDREIHVPLKNNMELYSKLFETPWIVDENDVIYKTSKIENDFNKIVSHHNNSIFSIITETQNSSIYTDIIQGNKIKPDYDSLSTFQIGDKTLLTLLSETFMLLIADPIYYVELEKLGFDFSYLKTIFGIDYKNISFLEFYNSLDGIIEFIRNSTIEDLNKLRESNIEIIKNNRKLAEKFVFADFDETEINFFKEVFSYE